MEHFAFRAIGLRSSVPKRLHFARESQRLYLVAMPSRKGKQSNNAKIVGKDGRKRSAGRPKAGTQADRKGSKADCKGSKAAGAKKTQHAFAFFAFAFAFTFT